MVNNAGKANTKIVNGMSIGLRGIALAMLIVLKVRFLKYNCKRSGITSEIYLVH